MRLKTDLLALILGRSCIALIAVIAVRAVTTYLSPEQYGQLSLLVALQMFCGLILINPVGQRINLYTHAWWDDGTLMLRLRQCRNFILIVSLIGALLTTSVSTARPVEVLVVDSLAVFIMVLAATWNATLIPMLNMLGFSRASVFWSIVTATVGIGCSVALVVWIPTGTAWFFGQSIGMAIGALGANYVLSRRVKVPVSASLTPSFFERSTLFSYFVPLAVATGFMWLQVSGYRFLVEWKWGLAQLGFLALGLQLAGQVWSFAESLSMQFFYPLFYRRLNEDRSEVGIQLAVADLINTLVPIYLILSGFIISAGPYLLRLVVAPQFASALNFVFLGAAIELCRVMGNLFSNAAQAKGQTKTLVLPYALGSAIIFGVIQLAATLQSPIGRVGVALVIGGVVMLVALFISMRRIVRFRLDFMRCIAALVLMLGMSALFIWLPEPSGVLGSIAMLFALGALLGTTLIIIFKSNPATARLLSVRLRGP